MNTMGLVKDIGGDLMRTDKLASDLNKRKLLNIAILYLIIVLLFITNCLVIYYKFHH